MLSWMDGGSEFKQRTVYLKIEFGTGKKYPSSSYLWCKTANILAVCINANMHSNTYTW